MGGRPRNPVLLKEILALYAQDMGVKKIAKMLTERGQVVSMATVARRIREWKGVQDAGHTEISP